MFENLKIKTRFFILIGVIVIANLIVALIELISFNSVINNLNDVYSGGVEEIRTLDALRDIYSENILDTAYLIQEGKYSSSQGVEVIKEAKLKVNDLWIEYKNNILSDSTSKNQINQIDSQIKEAAVLIDKFQEALKLDDKETVTRLTTQDLSVSITNLLKQLRNLTNLHVEETKQDYQNAVTTINSIRNYSILIFIIATILVLLIASWIASSIISAIKKSVGIINKLTAGDLNFEIENTSKSELGQLLEAMKTLSISDKKMGEALTAISNGNLKIDLSARSEQDILGLALVNMIRNLRTIIGQIQSEVTNLTISSQEIVSSVSQVATSSAETAAAVTETTTSVEELKQTAHVTDEKAKDVLGNSEETLQIVNTSEKLLQATIDDMKQISEKMHTISEGIVKLSEHSQTIGEIIDSVNDLAEQSNLLAVNAAIEAAKAGEHGKGFVVVAQEIRTLAEQSKSATIQVRSILNEIQNSTTAAVLATEQGAKAVEKGVKQSAQTNESMQTLSMSVTRVTQAANQIAISSQQQFVGIDQVTVAMNNISEATTQLVDHMKQIETAVSSLNSTGTTLKEITDQYTLENNEPRFLNKDNQTKKKTPLAYSCSIANKNN